MDTYTTRRRSGGGDRPNNASTDDALGENWKSALCVTSLYDSYVAVQHENDHLKDQLRQLQHANELLTVANTSNTNKRHQRRPELANDPTVGKEDVVDLDNDALVQELRLIRAEKAQQELLFDKRRVQLEAQLDQYKTLYTDLQTKYQQKCELDPLGPQRMAIATKTLQSALDQSVREKEEIVGRHTRLMQLHHALEKDYEERTKTLALQNEERRAGQVQTATRRMQRVLTQWMMQRVARAWQQWRLVLVSERLLVEKQTVVQTLQEQIAIEKQARVHDRGATLTATRKQKELKRTLDAWKTIVNAKKHKRRQVMSVENAWRHKMQRHTWQQWRREVQTRQNLILGTSKLETLLCGHAKRRVWRQWKRHSMHVHAGRQQETIDELQTKVVRLESLVTQLTQTLEATTMERDTLTIQVQQTTVAHGAHAQALLQSNEQALRRVGEVLYRRMQRHTIRDYVSAWRQVTEERRVRQHKITSFQHDHATQALRNTVTHWHTVAQSQQRSKQITRQAVQRMRLLSAYRCLVAWRELTTTRKERMATLARVIHHMKHRHVIKCFGAWTQYRTRRQHQRQQLTRVAAITTRLEVVQSFGIWKKTVTAMVKAAEQLNRQKIEIEWRQRLEQSKHELKQLRGYFQQWHRSVRKDQRVRQLTTKITIKWKYGMQSKCYDEWKAFVQRRRMTREVLTRLMTRRIGSEKQAAWMRWRLQTLMLSNAQTLENLTRAYETRVHRLEQELDEFRYADTTSKATTAERVQQLQSELCIVQSTCTQYKTVLQSMCLTLHEKRLRRHCLRAWQAAVRRSHLEKQLVEDARRRAQAANDRRVLHVWHYHTQRRRRMVSIVTYLHRFRDAGLLSDCYRVWCQYVAHQYRVRRTTAAFEAKAHRRLCSSILQAWRRDTRTSRLLRMTLEQIWLASIHTHVLERFTQWRDQTREARVYDELQRKQLALDTIRTRICARWTTRSLAATFAAWRHGVIAQKHTRAGTERLRRLHDLRLFAIAFGAWNSWHSTLCAQRTWLSRWLTHQQRKAVMASWQKWKMWTHQSRQDEISSLQEMCRHHEEVLAVKQLELTEVLTHHEQLTTRVTMMQHEHRQVEATTTQLTSRMIIIQCFLHWQCWTKTNVKHKASVNRWIQRRSTRRKQYVLNTWIAMVSMQQDQQQKAERAFATRTQRFLRQLLSAWRTLVLRQRCTTRMVRSLHSRQKRQTQATVFVVWQHFIQRSRATHWLVTLLDKTISNLAQRTAFLTWQHVLQYHKTRLALETEKQRRILVFMMDKHAYALAKYFNAWHTLGCARHARMNQVHKRFQHQQHKRLRAVWTAWQSFLHWHKISVSVIRRLLQTGRHHQVRVAFAHWKRQDTTLRLEILHQQHQQLATDRNRLQRELEATQADAIQLQETVARHEAREDETHRSIVATQAICADQVRDAQRRRVLTVLVARTHMPLATAFQRWRCQSMTETRWIAALRQMETLVHRKLQAQSFSRWRRRVAQLSRLGMTLARRDAQRLQWVFRAWTRWMRDRSMQRRRFLVRYLEATLRRQTQINVAHKVIMAFRLWQLQTTVVNMSDQLHVATTENERDHSSRRTQQRRFMLLSKWCWRAYAVRCDALRNAMGQWRATLWHETVDELQHQVQQLEQDQIKQLEIKRTSATIDETVVAAAARGIQTVVRRLVTAQSCVELFDAVTTSISQVSAGHASGILYLLDPATNELWTQRRDASHTTHAPATLGLAGSSLASGSILFIENATRDERFHPLVDQLVVSGVASTSTEVMLFTTAITGVDGVAYGVLQLAFAAVQREESIQNLRTRMQLLGHVCGFFVEQLVYEMVRHSRDRVRARSPSTFAKLFKQTKNWRKYFTRVEREAEATAQQLRQLLAEQEKLAEDKARLHGGWAQLEAARREAAQEKATTTQQHANQELLMKHLLVYKKKTAKLKDLVHDNEQKLIDKSRELDRVQQELTTIRQQAQSREWQELLEAVSPRKRPNRKDEDNDKTLPKYDLLRGADVAALQNELVRVESDSLLLVQAVDIATRRQGELPTSLKTEVDRIARRLKKARD